MAGNLQNLPQPGILTELLSILFPLRCAHCGRAGNWLCDECAEQLRPIGPAICRRCGRPLPASMPDCPECRGRELQFDRARAAFCFDGPARSLVHRLKYSGQRRLASFMADLSLEAMADLTENCERVNLTSVPLHSSKLVSRGYNQAGMYARALSRRLEVPLRDILTKHRLTTPQNRLDFDQRRKNLIGSFSLKPDVRLDGSVVLIDDVYTTGSTAAECAGMIREGLGVDVYVWTFARTVKRQESSSTT